MVHDPVFMVYHSPCVVIHAMGDVMVADGDIIAGAPQDWLVIGWFTPDYRPLAQTFAANLAKHGIPFHLWAKPALTGWNTSQKPSVVLAAMDAYPGKTLILMDVDCIVNGDIAPVAGIATDVSITVLARNVARTRRQRRHVGINCGSRVVVFRPTPGARAFAVEWQSQVKQEENDEHAMAWAFLRCRDASYSFIDWRYSGREVTHHTADVVICHDSAHEKRARKGLREMLKAIELRYFRTGRTRVRKLQGEMSKLIQL
jgi:hypothetical protein